LLALGQQEDTDDYGKTRMFHDEGVFIIINKESWFQKIEFPTLQFPTPQGKKLP